MRRPNILFLMADQMQGRILQSGHPCQMPNLRRLAERGVSFDRAYTTNAICSPARAGIMTGLLPHSHGVLTVTHCVDNDQSCLRDVPHWAQRLSAAGYRTGYFGKWHVERSGKLDRFGWQNYADTHDEPFIARRDQLKGDAPAPKIFSDRIVGGPPGYHATRLYGVTNQKLEQRNMGIATSLGLDFLDQSLGGSEPWCCFVSVTEPHDPFICGQDAFASYDIDSLALPPNVRDDLSERPGLYRKLARVFADMTDRQRREAMARYYALNTEIDRQFGRLIDRVERAGRLEDTIVVVTSDHGEMLGAHGLYCKNVGAFEEVYNIPMILAGPGIARGQTSPAFVGSHDLCPTLLDLCGLETIGAPDSRSFAPAARDPQGAAASFDTGFAEFHGTRYMISQRILWHGGWKLVHNGFDFDELYDLAADPFEMHNLAERPEHQARLRQMMAILWRRVKETGDHTLDRTHYPAMRVAPFGPEIVA